MTEDLVKNAAKDDRIGLVIVFRHTSSVVRYIIRMPEYERIRHAMIMEHDTIIFKTSDGAEVVLKLHDVLVIQQELK